MKIKTSELTGAALDWVVNQIEECCDDPHAPCFSTNWAQGGPIIERECITLDHDGFDEWEGRIVGVWMEYGPTPLIAAMRCYVGAKVGNEVDVPDELTQGETK